MSGSNDMHSLTPGKALIVLLFVILGIIVYVAIATALGIKALYAGFAFAFYFGGLKGASLGEWPAAVIGSLGGLLVAALLHILPQHYGTAGYVVALLLIVVAIYALLLQWASLLINQAFMLMLTIGTIPPVMADEPFVDMACAILLAAAFLGGLQLIANKLAAGKELVAASN